MGDRAESRQETTGTRRPIVPLFPLPEFFLYPSILTPLRVFEPRYRQMVEDLLDVSGRLVICAVEPGHEGELAGAPPVPAIAGLGEIVKHDRTEDGCYLIWVLGLQRVRLAEVASDRLYRKVAIEPFEEVAVAKEEQTALRGLLVDAVRRRAREVKLPKEAPIAQLVDVLLSYLALDVRTKLSLYTTRDVTARARGALEQHMLLPAPPAAKRASKRSPPPAAPDPPDAPPPDGR